VPQHHHPPGPGAARHHRGDRGRRPQYVRKVSGVTRPTPSTEEAFEQAVAAVARATAEVLGELPPRRQPPKADPPLRRPEVRARLASS
jgi:hypothetical protein